MSKDLYIEIGQKLEEEHGCTMGQMFGKPCIKIGGKAFAAFFKDEMVFKLGQEAINSLKDKYTGSVNWDPSGKGRAMKDWLQVPGDFSDDWLKLAEKAMKFVSILK